MSPSVHLTPLRHVTTTEAAAWHEVVAASMAHDLPGVPPPSPGHVHAQLTRPALGSHRLTWLATGADGVPVGAAGVRLFTSPGQEHLAELELHVAPAHRRLGTGSLLLTAAVEACRAENRRSLITTAAADGPGESFGERKGFRRVLAFDHLVLRLDEQDESGPRALADAEHPGYRLAGWTGTVPDDLADAFAAAKDAMNDMPVGDMDHGRVTWDADRVRAMARVVADRGDTLLTLAALHHDGTMAGYTEILLPQGAPARAQQYDTAVVSAHRGHGLGLWIKAAMVCRLRAEHPGVVEIETDNAEDNTHMLAVNTALGFRSYRRTVEFQLDLTPGTQAPAKESTGHPEQADAVPPVSRERISGIAHADHPIKAPLDDHSVGALLERGLPRGDERVLDLGCGTAEWLLRALATRPDLHAEGVDVSEVALTQARRAASGLVVDDRLVLHHQPAADFVSTQPFDLVISVGATHAFGGLLPTLEAARGHLAPGGRVLIGESIWDRAPSSEAVEMFGDLDDLATTVDRVVADGWTPVHGHVSTRRELDDYEWACWGSLAAWALDHPDDPAAAQVLETADAQRSQWLHGYRDSFGFLCLVLRRTSD